MFRLMQNLGLDTTGAYPFVRAAILGHAMRKDNRSVHGMSSRKIVLVVLRLNYKYKLCFSGCRLQYTQCPSDTDLLLNYFNNHNGGLFQNTLPSVTNEVPTIPTYKYMMSWA